MPPNGQIELSVSLFLALWTWLWVEGSAGLLNTAVYHMASKGGEAVMVVVRMRPFNQKEKSEGRGPCISLDLKTAQVTPTFHHSLC